MIHLKGFKTHKGYYRCSLVYLLLVFLFLGLGWCGGAEEAAIEHTYQVPEKPISYYVDRLLDQLADNKIIDNYRMFLVGMGYDTTYLSTEMGRYFWNIISKGLQQQGGYTLVERIEQSPELAQPYLSIQRNANTLDGFLIGKYTLDERGVTLSLNRHILINGHVEGKAEVTIPYKNVPTYIMEPPDLPYYIQYCNIFEIGFEFSPDVKAIPNQGIGGYYTPGESLWVYIQTTFDAYIKIFVIKPDKSLVQLVPNLKNQENYLEAYRTYSFPQRDSFQLESLGNHVLMILSRPVQFKDYEGYVYEHTAHYPIFKDMKALQQALLANGPDMGNPTRTFVPFSVWESDVLSSQEG